MSVEIEGAAATTLPERSRRTLADLIQGGVEEISEGVRNWRMWYLMGSAEMRRRFERSRLGPVWIAISTSVMVLCIGFVWTALWNASLPDILPFIAIGLVTWGFLSSVTSDATLSFQTYSGYFANQYMAPSNVVFAIVYKNLITYLINLVVPILVCIVFATPFDWASFLAVPGLVLQVYVMFCAAYIVAIACARYRDVIQIVQNLIQLGFFLTPILWKPDLLSADVQRLVLLNPAASLIAIVRDPMLGVAPPAGAWETSIGAAIILTIVMLPLVGAAHRRVVYWL